jgi:hypothetical protein
MCEHEIQLSGTGKVTEAGKELIKELQQKAEEETPEADPI